MRRCPFPKSSPGEPELDPHGPQCGAPLQYRGLIASNFCEEGNELYRWDCPQGHSVLAEFTDEMGDLERELEQQQPPPPRHWIHGDTMGWDRGPDNP
jgi:hypothetical protein